jgi:Acetyltransferase (GNAT) domain
MEPDDSTNQAEQVGGYLHPAYIHSLGEWGAPRRLPLSRGWLLERCIPGTSYIDGMGAYPLFCCRDWTRLGADLAALGSRLVAVSLVVDPFADVESGALQRDFDIVRPWKQHFVTDLDREPMATLPRSHRRNVANAMRQVVVERCIEPTIHLDEWVTLYAALCLRRHVRGLRAFSRAAFALQVRVPGLVMFRAEAGGETVGLHLWYVQGEVAYAHLGATNERGLALMASYALFMFAIEYFRSQARWLDLGAAAGSEDSPENGLSRFKRGFATGTRAVQFCGRVLNWPVYSELAASGGVTDWQLGEGYFPRYREGEFY